MSNEQEIKPTILIVDDNAKNLQVIGSILLAEDFEIEFATNGEIALEWLSIKQFDIVLLDINLPIMDGFEVCKKIRSDTKTNKIPIIFLSAETDRDVIFKGFELGAQDYITKPFDSRELLVKVKTQLKLKKSLENIERLELTILELKKIDSEKTKILKLISSQIRIPLDFLMSSVKTQKDTPQYDDLFTKIRLLDDSINKIEQISSKEIFSCTAEEEKIVNNEK